MIAKIQILIKLFESLYSIKKCDKKIRIKKEKFGVI